jgi:hypothetical protein
MEVRAGFPYTETETWTDLSSGKPTVNEGQDRGQSDVRYSNWAAISLFRARIGGGGMTIDWSDSLLSRPWKEADDDAGEHGGELLPDDLQLSMRESKLELAGPL